MEFGTIVQCGIALDVAGTTLNAAAITYFDVGSVTVVPTNFYATVTTNLNFFNDAAVGDIINLLPSSSGAWTNYTALAIVVSYTNSFTGRVLLLTTVPINSASTNTYSVISSKFSKNNYPKAVAYYQDRVCHVYYYLFN
jgi:hypothetical protein